MTITSPVLVVYAVACMLIVTASMFACIYMVGVALMDGRREKLWRQERLKASANLAKAEADQVAYFAGPFQKGRH